MSKASSNLDARVGPRGCRGWSHAAWTACAVAFACLVARAALPNQQHRESDVAGDTVTGEVWGQNANGFDDVVTMVTARNFARDGFLRTHLLPNRKGAPLVSYFDFSETQCAPVGGGGHPPLLYRGLQGKWIDLISANRDCVYTHYPPLADWVFGAMAAVGLDSILDFRILAVAVSCCTLGLLFHWLARMVHPAAALSAMVLVAISPAFFLWAAALFYFTFQYFFLLAGLVCWCRFLEGQERRWFLLTFVLFFLEALVSYELILFFGLVVAGTTFLERPGASWGCRLRWLAAQAAAPALATLLHLGLRVSLLGFAPTWRNIVATAVDRYGWGWTPVRVQTWWNRIELWLMRLDLAALAVVLVLVVRLVDRDRPWRSLGWLLLTVAGGLSFLAAFPGTAWVHSWMMYRHLMPAAALLTALAIDAALRCFRGTVVSLPMRWAGARPALRLLLGTALLVPAGWSLRQGVAGLSREIAWVTAANRHHDPANQAVRYLEVVHWMETEPYYDIRARLAVDGRRVEQPANALTTFFLPQERDHHFEIWWLDEVQVGSVRVLTDADASEMLATHCRWSLFDGLEFRPVLGVPAAVELFRPEAGEPQASYAWWTSAVTGRTRAIRLSCGALGRAVPLHEVEVR